MSLLPRAIDNQVRAFAGLFVLASLALGWWFHPGFFLFTAFVGINLLQSAYTCFCPLEKILRKVQSPPIEPPIEKPA